MTADDLYHHLQFLKYSNVDLTNIEVVVEHTAIDPSINHDIGSKEEIYPDNVTTSNKTLILR